MGTEAENAFMSAFGWDALTDNTDADTPAHKGKSTEHTVPLPEASSGRIEKLEALIKELQEDVRKMKGMVQRSYEESLDMLDMQKGYYDEFISFVRSVSGDERKVIIDPDGMENGDSREKSQPADAEELTRISEENNKLRSLIAAIAAESDAKSDALEDKESQIDSLLEEIDSLKDQLYGVNPQAVGSQRNRHNARKRILGMF